MNGFSMPARFPRASKDVLDLNPHLTGKEIAAAVPVTPTKPKKAQPKGRTPNKTEQSYYNLFVRPRLQSGEMHVCLYEAVTFKLAHDTRYTPDWYCWMADGSIMLVEVKGAHVWDDAKVKAKVCAEMFPHRLVYAQYSRKLGWNIHDVPGIYTRMLA